MQLCWGDGREAKLGGLGVFPIPRIRIQRVWTFPRLHPYHHPGWAMVPVTACLLEFPRAQQQQQMPLCLLSGACCQDNARSCQSRHRHWLLCQLHGVWGPAGGCLSPGWWNLPAPLGVWGRGAEFTTITVLSEKPSKDVGSLEAMSVSHPLAVGRHVEF